MKKLLFLISLLLMIGCLASCTPTTPSDTSGSGQGTTNTPVIDKNFISPVDEQAAVYYISKVCSDGLKLEVTLHGYQSESLDKSFYVKNNEYFLADIKITNESDTDLYQILPTFCRNQTTLPSHNHEIKFDIFNGEYKLHSSSFGFACGDLIDIWTIEAGKSYEWQLKLAAGEPGDDGDLQADGVGAKIKLYDKTVFTDHVCVFDGEFSFDYKKTKGFEADGNTVSVPVSIEMVYVSPVPNE